MRREHAAECLQGSSLEGQVQMHLPVRGEGGVGDFADGPPAAFVIAGGVVTIVAACLVASWIFPAAEATERLVVLALAVAAFAGAVRSLACAVAVSWLSWVFFLGFLADQQGELRWHGPVDVVRLAVIGGAALAGLAVRWSRRVVRSTRVDTRIQAGSGGEGSLPRRITWVARS